MTRTLYLVGTPIGNLEDISPRALQVLREAALIAAENPARTQRLLARYDLHHMPMLRYTDAYDRKKEARLQAVLKALRRGDVAFVSEAGMPLLADPGYELVQAALERGIAVASVPGPTALAAALSVSGLAAAPLTFLGFLPRKSSARRGMLRPFAGDRRTLAVYESPNRLLALLRDIRAELGERQVAVANELTKMYEHTWRGTAGAAVAYFEGETPRGEYVVVIAGAEEEA